jgi:(2R)-ethylmalonyl-CoA mutase
VPEVLACLTADGVDALVVVGGIIPEDDRATLLRAGVRAVYTPKDFELGRIMDEIADLAAEHRTHS